MRRFFVSGVALLALTGVASGAELSGYITFIHPDENMIVVDNGNRFTLGTGIDKANLQLGARVEVTYEGSGDQLTASAIEVVPLAVVPQAPVAGAAGGADAGAAGGGAAGGLGGAAGGALPGAPAGDAPAAPAAPAP